MTLEYVNSSAVSAAFDMDLKKPPTSSKQYMLMNWIDGLQASTATTGQTDPCVKQTYETSKPKTSPTLTYSAEGFHANPFRLLANDQNSKTHVAHSFMKLYALQKKNNPRCFFSKTSMACSQSTKEKPFAKSSKTLGNWGIYANGTFLTADTLEYLSPVAESSLSHILQNTHEVDKQFFLSQKTMKTIIRKLGKKSFRPRLLHPLGQNVILEGTGL